MIIVTGNNGVLEGADAGSKEVCESLYWLQGGGVKGEEGTGGV